MRVKFALMIVALFVGTCISRMVTPELIPPTYGEVSVDKCDSGEVR